MAGKQGADELLGAEQRKYPNIKISKIKVWPVLCNKWSGVKTILAG